MSIVNPTFTEWRDERLYVLNMIEDLKMEQRRQLEAQAVTRATIEEKAQKDINSAHNKIRTLEEADSHLKIKNWIMTGVLSSGAAVVFEMLKWVLTKK
jgi:predicted XRE-type DNA-binding protein